MKLTDKEFWDFISQHESDDTAKLRMKYHGDDRGYIDAIRQIELRRKSPEKFVGSDGKSCRPALLHSAVAVEQSTSARVAAFHASLATPGSRVLDMTMGMGMDASAFASLNGCYVTAIEKQSDLYDTSVKNYAHLSNLEIINADSVEWIRATDCRFDLIFIDPARRDINGNRVYNIHDCTPDVGEIMPLLLAHAPKVIVKLSPMLDITATLKDLPGTSLIYIVEERGECRELLAVVQRGFIGEAEIVVVNGSPIFSFKLSQETCAEARFGMPSKGEFMYEPSAATMKAAPFKLLSTRFDLTAIAPNSHLYFSKSHVDLFPGKEYEIVDVLPYSSGVLKRFSRQWPNVSVAVRNFPESADKLRARLNVRESDSLRLMATTDVAGNKVLFLLKHTSH